MIYKISRTSLPYLFEYHMYHIGLSTLPNIVETELMTVLKTKKEEQIVSLKKDIVNTREDDF